MTYQEVIDYLFHQFPQYQKIGGKAFKPGLDNVQKLCAYLGNPQEDLTFIHVAGTNGKGSVCSMLASILKEADYRVGLFTSPHLVDFSERIRINGVPISQEAIIKFVEKHKAHFDESGASFFEWSLALALACFKEQEVDVVVLETGLGGRLDATNIVQPILTVITSIGIDHTQYLGHTLHEIAKEKAGIIKQEVPVVTTISNPVDALEVINQQAFETQAPICLAPANDQLPSDLTGGYQRINKGIVLKCVDVLKDLDFTIQDEDVAKGLLNVKTNAGLRGRWEVLQTAPRVVADIGHNFDGVKEVVEQLDKESYSQLHIVWGMVEDKEVERVLEILPKEAKYYLSAPDIARAMKKEVLASFFEGKFEFVTYNSVSESFNATLQVAEDDDLIFVGGSTFVVAEIISNFF